MFDAPGMIRCRTAGNLSVNLPKNSRYAATPRRDQAHLKLDWGFSRAGRTAAAS
jgi:hypothetical protein